MHRTSLSIAHVVPLTALTLALSACSDRATGPQAETSTTADAAPAPSSDETAEPSDASATTADHDAHIPDLHGDPDDLDGGERLCAEIRNTCHPFDKGTGDLGNLCHEWGHEGDPDVCTEHYDECMTFCTTMDAGADHGDAAGHTHADEGDAAAHDHSHEPIELTDHENLPSIDLVVAEDAVSGWNLHSILDKFTLAPQHASTAYVPGEGHMHLYVDGEKYTRVYGNWFHLPELTQGEHTVRMELSANSHNPFSHDGEIIDDEVTIVQGEQPNTHTHELLNVDATDAPEVTLLVHNDPMSGWNLQVELANFTLAPEHASQEHVLGEGHMHLYIDGVKMARVYSEWFYLSDLSEGEHEITIGLNTNDHRAYAIDDAPIESSVMVEVSAAQAGMVADAGAVHEHLDMAMDLDGGADGSAADASVHDAHDAAP